MHPAPARFHGASLGEDCQADTCQPLLKAAGAGRLQFAAVVHGAYPGVALPATVLPRLCSAGAWNAHDEQDWGLDWHHNEGIEFTYLFSGRLGFAVEGGNHQMRPGCLTITRPWQRHRVGLPRVGASHLAWLILDVGVRRPNQAWRWPEWLVLTRGERGRLAALLGKNEQPLWKTGAGPAGAFRRIEEIARTAAARRFDRTRMALAVNELLLVILETLEGMKIPLDDSLTSNERCVELFLSALPRRAGEEWTVDSMAARCGLKRSRFTTYCQQLTNRPPAQYLSYCRVKAAARLLRERPGLPVTEIAYACGFSSSQHFATVFREFNGMSPTQWREKARAD
ncbi:MAG: AraC family transcriptional regulator [Opitutaceae bacterium]|jgi:AraC family L-rhamnose operon regulatory protein RhaS|nr:AraC family transcriptional regulator [Opitutaceae bacterium]